jgi:hypothetical protein
MPEDIFRWVIAGALVLLSIASVWQAVALAIIFRAGKEAGKEAGKASKEAQAKIGPLVDRFEGLLTVSGKILEENRSRIADITAETLVIARTARQQAEHIAALMDDVNGRAKARIAQIDETVDHTVAQVEQATGAVKSVVTKPVKEAHGILAGVKAALSTYAQGGSRNSPEHATQDEEMFI